LRKPCLEVLKNSIKDPVKTKILTPKFDPGCKRLLVSDEYLLSLNNDNVKLINDKVHSIYENGVKVISESSD